VSATAILRKYDSFIEGQITDSRERYGNLDIQRSALSKIENLFYDSQGSGINKLIDDFFNALQDLSSNPSGTPERVAVLSKADALAGAINNVYSDLIQLQKDMNNQVNQTVADVNRITTQIADLNEKISQAENIGQNANDYRDMRGVLLNDLAEKIDIQSFEDGTGQITVIGAGSVLLVERGNSWDLSVESNPDNNGYYNIVSNTSGSNSIDVTNRISEGRLKGLLTIRDSVTPDAIDNLDRLAAAAANEINQVHRAGYGLGGSTGTNFFTPGFEAGDGVSAVALSTNSGTGNVSATINNPAQLTYQAYELTFSGGNYTITNKSTKTSSPPASYTAPGPTTFTFEGLSVTITGIHSGGDKYTISAHKEAAQNIQVAIAISDSDKIAAATASTSNRGDNRNALAIAQLQDKLAIDGTSNFSNYYGSVAGEIGANSQSVNRTYTAQKFSLEQLKNMRESVSGVSLDEEMANLMKYQRSFEAAARLITIGDELLQTILKIAG
jgi:flagellar hook-associated protein 1 FlgK